MRACDYYLFKIQYKYRYYERSGIDDDPTGRILEEEAVYNVVAPTEEFAMADYNRLHSIESIYTFISIEKVLNLQGLVTIP